VTDASGGVSRLYEKLTSSARPRKARCQVFLAAFAPSDFVTTASSTAPGKVAPVNSNHRSGCVELRQDIRITLREESEMADKTLYERLGGAYAIATAVDHLIDRLHTNATLNSRNRKVAEFHTEQYRAGYKFMVTAWCVEETGGPKCYPGRDMFESHKQLGLTDYEFDVTAHEIRNTLYQLGVPPQEIGEFMGIIEGYRDKVLSRA
jgi:hemoglobin